MWYDSHSRALRLFVDACIFASIFLFPWWVYVPLVVIAVFYFPVYVEAPIVGLLADALFAPADAVFSYPFSSLLMTAAGVLVFCVALFVHSRIRL